MVGINKSEMIAEYSKQYASEAFSKTPTGIIVCILFSIEISRGFLPESCSPLREHERRVAEHAEGLEYPRWSLRQQSTVAVGTWSRTVPRVKFTDCG